MPLKLKTGNLREKYINGALRRRAQDEKNIEYTPEEIDFIVSTYLRGQQYMTKPDQQPGQVISSDIQRVFLRDARLWISLLAEETNGLEGEIQQSANDAFSTLDDLQREILSLTSLVTEDEIRGTTQYNNVHYNMWTRTEDQPLDYDAGGWLKDFKTNLTFLPTNMCQILAGRGLVLPSDIQTQSLITRVSLLSEESDFGDTPTPIVQGDPMDLIRENKTFRHVIASKAFDNTSRVYNQSPVYLTVLIEMPVRQLVNELVIRPLGHSPVNVVELSYFDEDANEVALPIDSETASTFTCFLFEPVRTRYIKVKFAQYSPIAKTSYNVKDKLVDGVNEILSGQGFTQLLPDTETEIQGSIFDFSMEQISVGLKSYVGKGIYRSAKRTINQPRGLEVVDNSYSVQATDNDEQILLPDGVVLPEYYVGLDLYVDGVQTVNALLPAPTDGDQEQEMLPLVGDLSRFRFLPDLEVEADVDLEVYANDTLLTIGADYEISLDGGVTYYTNFADIAAAFEQIKMVYFAGRAKVRILTPVRDAVYWCSYTPYRDQKLNAAGTIWLRDNRIVFEPALADAVGTIQTVIVMRAQTANVYTTPVVKSYTLKVRENVV